jgi:uncharacterized protein HemX
MPRPAPNTADRADGNRKQRGSRRSSAYRWAANKNWGEPMDTNKTTVLCAVISGLVAIGVAYITTGSTFKSKFEQQTAEVQQLSTKLGEAQKRMNELQSSTESFKAKADAEEVRLVEAERTLSASRSAVNALKAELDKKVEEVRSAMPHSFRPSPGNCKTPSQTPGYIAGAPKVCGTGYVMNGINQQGEPSCCTLEAVQ